MLSTNICSDHYLCSYIHCWAYASLQRAESRFDKVLFNADNLLSLVAVGDDLYWAAESFDRTSAHKHLSSVDRTLLGLRSKGALEEKCY